MGLTRVINRYATALFNDAVEAGVLEKVYKDSMTILSVLEDNRELNTLLKNPTIQSLKKLVVLKKIFASGLNDITFSYIEMVARHKRESLIKGIFQQFNNLYKEENGILDAEVISAAELDSKTLDTISVFLKEKTGAKVIELVNSVDENLIGGFMLKFQNKILDTSILSQLNDMKKLLSQKA